MPVREASKPLVEEQGHDVAAVAGVQEGIEQGCAGQGGAGEIRALQERTVEASVAPTLESAETIAPLKLAPMSTAPLICEVVEGKGLEVMCPHLFSHIEKRLIGK